TAGSAIGSTICYLPFSRGFLSSSPARSAGSLQAQSARSLQAQRAGSLQAQSASPSPPRGARPMTARRAAQLPLCETGCGGAPLDGLAVLDALAAFAEVTFSTSLSMVPASILPHMTKSARSDWSGYLNVAGLFPSTRKWPIQAKP